MKTYLVTLTPQEPYFFGNEKTFLFDKEKNQGQRGNSYYIRSERTPLQSTLMGMMRYILMPYKDYQHPQENALVIGGESFRIDAEGQSFGVMKKIYPLFLMKDGIKLVKTPLDCQPNGEAYTPFSNYAAIETDKGEKLFTPDYDSKEGLADSYMNLSDGTLVPAGKIFGTETRVGNLKATSGKNEKGFFKKEYIYLMNDYCFAFYAELDENAVLPKDGKTQAFLGQGKSLFSVSFTEQENTLEAEVKKYLPEGLSYCLSDVFADAEVLEHSKVDSSFRGQISSFGAAVVMGSLKSAVAFFADDGDAKVPRSKLIIAIYYVITGKITEKPKAVFDYICKNDNRQTKEQFINASIAIKLALNFFDMGKGEKTDKKNGED